MNNVRAYIISELQKIDVSDCVIIDWGSGDHRATRYIRHSRCEIINVDIKPDPKTTIVTDICQPLTIKEADLAFCLEVLEHCYDPNAVLSNIYNNLKVGGKLLISVPFICPYHSRKDYWRWTGLGITTLLRQHKFKVLRTHKSRDTGRVGLFAEATK